MQHSEFLETRPSAFQSVFSLYTKSNACVCTLDSDITSILASHTRVVEPFPPQGIHTQ